MDLAAVDHVLTTTRSVRLRLDFRRPVDPALLQECLEIAIQAPTGGNLARYHFVIVTDPARRAAVADYYRRVFFEEYLPRRSAVTPDFPRARDAIRRLGDLPRPAPSRGSAAGDPVRRGAAGGQGPHGPGRGIREHPSGGVVVHARAARPRAGLRVDDAAHPVRARDRRRAGDPGDGDAGCPDSGCPSHGRRLSRRSAGPRARANLLGWLGPDALARRRARRLSDALAWFRLVLIWRTGFTSWGAISRAPGGIVVRAAGRRTRRPGPPGRFGDRACPRPR